MLERIAAPLIRHFSRIVPPLLLFVVLLNIMVQYNYIFDSQGDDTNLRLLNGRVGRHVNNAKNPQPTLDSSRVRRREHVRLKFVFPKLESGTGKIEDETERPADVVWTDITVVPVFQACLNTSDVVNVKHIREHKVCPCKPQSLDEYQKPSINDKTDIIVNWGGRWFPRTCTSRNRVAILVPWQKGANEEAFLSHMHRFLQRQRLNYVIFVINQTTHVGPVNYGELWNLGFLEARRLHPFNCYVFHDINILPRQFYNMYSCAHQPLILVTSIDGWKTGISFDGAVTFRGDHFEKIDGFSDPPDVEESADLHMYNKILRQNLTLSRYSIKYGEYSYIGPPDGDYEDPKIERFESIKTARNKGLRGMHYSRSRVSITKKRLYTLIEVNVSQHFR